MAELATLEERLGVSFKNKELLQMALVHRSYLNEHPQFYLDHNERLEFLGDAVLEMVVTEYLYRDYPNPEGELTNWRASLVNAQMLGELARTLDVNDHLLLSRGEAKDTNLKARQYILANAFEAIIGSMYLDQGMEMARDFIHRHLIVKLRYIIEHGLYLDPKSRFQEAAQDMEGVTPSYQVLEESGPDHAKHFKVGAFLGEHMIAAGEGYSKQEAQVNAAHAALKAKGWESYKSE